MLSSILFLFHDLFSLFFIYFFILFFSDHLHPSARKIEDNKISNIEDMKNNVEMEELKINKIDDIKDNNDKNNRDDRNDKLFDKEKDSKGESRDKTNQNEKIRRSFSDDKSSSKNKKNSIDILTQNMSEPKDVKMKINENFEENDDHIDQTELLKKNKDFNLKKMSSDSDSNIVTVSTDHTGLLKRLKQQEQKNGHIEKRLKRLLILFCNHYESHNLFFIFCFLIFFSII